MNQNLPYATRFIPLEILGHHFTLLEVADSGALLDELIEKGDAHEDVVDERIPYWAELWPSALGMAQFMLRRSEIQAGQKLLELGCGLGLPGIVAGNLGARVTLSDYLEPALIFARSNWQLNHTAAVELALLDWRQPNATLAADWVLASDITYEARNFPFLPQAFRTLCLPGGKIILSDPRRKVAEVFFENLPKEGFGVEQFEEEVTVQDRTVKINLYQLTYKT